MQTDRIGLEPEIEFAPNFYHGYRLFSQLFMHMKARVLCVTLRSNSINLLLVAVLMMVVVCVCVGGGGYGGGDGGGRL